MESKEDFKVLLLVVWHTSLFSLGWSGFRRLSRPVELILGWLEEKSEFSWHFLRRVFLSIVLIDLVLAGDNAGGHRLGRLKASTGKQRRTGNHLRKPGRRWLAGGPLPSLVAQLLTISFHLIYWGGILIPGGSLLNSLLKAPPRTNSRKEATTFWQAIRVIVIADPDHEHGQHPGRSRGLARGISSSFLFGLASEHPFVVLPAPSSPCSWINTRSSSWIGAASWAGRRGDDHHRRVGSREKLLPALYLKYACEIIGAVGVLVGGQIIHAMEDRPSMLKLRTRGLNQPIRFSNSLVDIHSRFCQMGTVYFHERAAHLF